MKKLLIGFVILLVVLILLNKQDTNTHLTTTSSSGVAISTPIPTEPVANDVVINKPERVVKKTTTPLKEDVNISKKETSTTDTEKLDSDRVNIECVYIPKTDKDLCYQTNSNMYQIEPGKSIDEYLREVGDEIKNSIFPTKQRGKFCGIEKIEQGYKAYYCKREEEIIEAVTMTFKGIDSDGILHLEASSYKYFLED